MKALDPHTKAAMKAGVVMFCLLYAGMGFTSFCVSLFGMNSGLFMAMYRWLTWPFLLHGFVSIPLLATFAGAACIHFRLKVNYLALQAITAREIRKRAPPQPRNDFAAPAQPMQPLETDA